MARLDKHRRKELLREAKRKEMASAFAALPVDNSELQALFDMLDVRLPVDGCDHSRRLTIAHIRERSLPEPSVLQWLDDNGGFCDCEVLANSEQAWEGMQGLSTRIVACRAAQHGFYARAALNWRIYRL